MGDTLSPTLEQLSNPNETEKRIDPQEKEEGDAICDGGAVIMEGLVVAPSSR